MERQEVAGAFEEVTQELRMVVVVNKPDVDIASLIVSVIMRHIKLVDYYMLGKTTQVMKIL